MSGRFIVIEGMDGAGTTTQTRLVSELLHSNGFSVEKTKEPYQGQVHDLIRKILSGDPEYQDYRASMTWLYMADRDYHLRNCVIPAMEKDMIVISDRYVPSTMAYQSENKGLTPYGIYDLHRNSRFITPDLMVYIKTPVEVCLERLADRPQQEIFEKKEFLTLLSERYDNSMKILRNYQWKVLEIDGTRNPIEISEQIFKTILKLNMK